MSEDAPNIGRRERKRLETRGRLIRAASALFAEKGYQNATMEDVSARADVGVGTVYNYFSSKEGLLLAVFEDATEPLLVEAQAVVAEPGTDAEGALRRLLETFEPLATLFDKAVLREMLAATLLQPAERVEEFATLDAKLAATIAELLSKLAERGAIARDVDLESAAMALYGAFTISTLLYLSVTDMDQPSLRELVRRQVAVVYTGLAPASAPEPSPGARRKRK